MSFYAWDTPEVAKFLNTEYSSKHHFYVSTDGTRNAVYKDDSRTFIGKSSIGQMKLIGIPEYKLHQKHGLVPANSKLFKEDNNKEQKDQQMKQQETKKVFEVGDKCVIRNIDNEFYVYEEATENFVDKEVTVMSKFTIPSTLEDSNIDMVSVMNKDGQCICFREEMCYPIKTEKEMTIEEIVDIVCSQGFPTKEGTASWAIANELYKAGYRKVGDNYEL